MSGYDQEIDLTDPQPKKYKAPTSCIWWMGSIRPYCGKPLAEGDPAFCAYHRRVVNEHRRVWERPA